MARKQQALNRIGAVGEELVKYHLLARNWDVINLNLIGNNRPNADLLAVKGKSVVRLQIKTSKYKDAVQLGWIQEGKTNVNSKIGDPADFFVMVGHEAPGNYSIHIIPAEYMKKWEQRNLAAHAVHGKNKNPGYLYFGAKKRKTKFAINQSGDEFAPFMDAWESLEALSQE
jgi:hypothetical protein